MSDTEPDFNDAFKVRVVTGEELLAMLRIHQQRDQLRCDPKFAATYINHRLHEIAYELDGMIEALLAMRANLTTDVLEEEERQIPVEAIRMVKFKRRRLKLAVEAMIDAHTHLLLGFTGLSPEDQEKRKNTIRDIHEARERHGLS